MKRIWTAVAIITTILALAAVITIVCVLERRHKRRRSHVSPAVIPVIPAIPAVIPVNHSTEFPVRLWISTYTDLHAQLTSSQLTNYYGNVVQFAIAFNAKFAAQNVSVAGIWVCIATAQSDLTAYTQLAAAAIPAGITLGCVLAPGTPLDPSDVINTMFSINAACGNAYTHMNFDSQSVTADGSSSSPSAVSTYLQNTVLSFLQSPGGENITHVSVCGGHQLTGAAITPAGFPVPVAGIFECYSFGSDCTDPGSGCTNPTPIPISDVVTNWWGGSHAQPYECLATRSITDYFNGASGASWPAISCASLSCTGGCLLSAYTTGFNCDDGNGSAQSFAAYGLANDIVGTSDAPGLLMQFGRRAKSGSLANGTPLTQLNVVLYESAFIPSTWFQDVCGSRMCT
jgi:hypothetical protein